MSLIRHTISATGVQRWRLRGQYHNPTGPAIIYPDGSYSYFINGQLSRIAGPALYYKSEDRTEWWFQGRLHRLGAPAYITPHYSKWARDNQLHCVTGPAIHCHTDHRKDRWFIWGTEYTFSGWLHRSEVTDRQKTYLIMRYGVEG